MSIYSRFMGEKGAADPRGEKLVANPEIKEPLSLQVLFPENCPLDSGGLTKALRSYHPSMSGGRCEIDPELGSKGTVLGLVGWGKHVIRCVGFDLPMPADAVEACVAPSHYPQALKAQARAHKAHVILYYAGYEVLSFKQYTTLVATGGVSAAKVQRLHSLFEQYVALAAVAGVLGRLGAIVVLNESGRTSFPAEALSGLDSGDDVMELLRTLPLSILYCGFVKIEAPGVPGVWMRTYGAPLLALPDLAAQAKGHEEGQRYFELFENVFAYLRETGALLSAGNTMEVGDDEFLRFRKPGAGEKFFSDEEDLLVVEIVGPGDMKRR